MKLRRRSWVFLLALVPGARVCAIDPPKWSTPKAETGTQLAMDIDQYLQELEKKGFSGIILLTKDGQDLLHKGYGFADRESGRRLTTDAGLTIGSIVKPITKADIIVVLDHGRIVELGTHMELMANDGLYRDMVERQHRFAQCNAEEPAM